MAASPVHWGTSSIVGWNNGFFQGPDTTIPETGPEKQGTSDLPGSVDQSDIEIESIASPDKKCDPNGAQVSVILLP